MMADNSSLMDQALKEGISVDGGKPSEPQTPPVVSKQDVKAESSPAQSKETVASAKESVSPAKESDEPDMTKVPLHLHGATKELLDERKRLREELRQAKELSKDPRVIRALAAQKEAVEEAPAKESKETKQSYEEREALDRLKEMLGINGVPELVKDLKRQNDELNQRESDRAFEQAEKKLVDRAAEFSLDFETEVEPAIATWLKANPHFQGIGPAVLDIAFESVFFNRIGELKERAINSKLIKERDEKKRQGTESPQGSLRAVEKSKSPHMRGHIEELIRDGGGIEL